MAELDNASKTFVVVVDEPLKLRRPIACLADRQRRRPAGRRRWLRVPTPRVERVRTVAVVTLRAGRGAEEDHAVGLDGDASAVRVCVRQERVDLGGLRRQLGRGQSVVAVDEQHRLRQVDAPTPTLDLLLEHGEPRGDGLQRAHKAGVVDVRTDGEASSRLLAVRVESLHPSHLALCRDEARLKQYAGQGR